MKKWISLFAVSLLFFIPGCGGKTESVTQTLEKEKENIIKFEDLEITFPQGSLTKDEEIYIEKSLTPIKDLPAGVTAIAPVYKITMESQPVKPVFVDFYFSAQAIPENRSHKNLLVEVLSDKGWGAPPGQLVDIASGKISIKVTDLTAFLCAASEKQNNTMDRKALSFDMADPKVQRFLNRARIEKDNIANIVEITPFIYYVFDVTTPSYKNFIRDTLEDFCKADENIKMKQQMISRKAASLTDSKKEFTGELRFFTKEKNNSQWSAAGEKIFQGNNEPTRGFEEMVDSALSTEQEILTKTPDIFVLQDALNPRNGGIGNLYFIYTITEGTGEELYSSSLLLLLHDKKINNYALYYRIDFSARLRISD